MYYTNTIRHLFIISTVILIYSQLNATTGSFSVKGQFWINGLHNTDAPIDQPSFETNVGYIPTFSFFKGMSSDQLVDMEWAYRLDRSYSGQSLLHNNGSHHRYWVRYSNEKLEARLGLQKIIFGPSQVLRTLSWFDTINLMDPTGQTDGVQAFRLRWFPSNSLSLWSWAINSDQDILSYGSRAELSSSAGEWGLTYHEEPTKSLQKGQNSISRLGPHSRLGVDYRYDGFIGFWNESALISSDKSKITMMTVGADYTLPIAGGVLVTAEYLSISNKIDADVSSQSYTALMTSIPLGMVHKLMFISQLDGEENHSYNYLRWSSTYDHYSLNFIISINPKQAGCKTPVKSTSKPLIGLGTSVQFMFVYNH